VRARPRPVSARSPDIVPAQPHNPSADVIPAEAGIHWRFEPGATAKVDSRVRGKDALRWLSPNSGIIRPEFGTMPEPEAQVDPCRSCAGAASNPVVASRVGNCTDSRETSEIVADFAGYKAGNGVKSRSSAATPWARRNGSSWDCCGNIGSPCGEP